MDPRLLTDEQRQTLGLPSAGGAVEVVELWAPPVAQGRGALSLSALVTALATGQVSVISVASDAARSAGAFLQHVPESRALIVGAATDGDRVAVRSLRGEEAHTLQDGSVVVALDPDNVYVVQTDEGTLSVGVADDVIVILEESLGAEPLVPLQADAKLLDLADEPWLRDCIAAYLQRGTSWGNLCAGAVLSRVATLDVAPDVVDERVAEPRRQARAMTDAQKRTAHDLAVARADRLLAEVDEMSDALVESDDVTTDDALHERLQEMCIERDDLQAVASLLWEAGAMENLPHLLTLLDDRAAVCAASFPLLQDVDVRLRIAAALEPDAWWTRLAEG